MISSLFMDCFAIYWGIPIRFFFKVTEICWKRVTYFGIGSIVHGCTGLSNHAESRQLCANYVCVSSPSLILGSLSVNSDFKSFKCFIIIITLCCNYESIVPVTVDISESPKFGDAPRSYSARSSPPHSIEHMLVFPGDSGNISSDSNWLTSSCGCELVSCPKVVVHICCGRFSWVKLWECWKCRTGKWQTKYQSWKMLPLLKLSDLQRVFDTFWYFCPCTSAVFCPLRSFLTIVLIQIT